MFSVAKRFSNYNRITLTLFSRRIFFVANRSFSNTNTVYNEEYKELKQKDDIIQKDVISSALHAFAARTQLHFSDQKILLQAVTHESFTDTDLLSNKRFRKLGILIFRNLNISL